MGSHTRRSIPENTSPRSILRLVCDTVFAMWLLLASVPIPQDSPELQNLPVDDTESVPETVPETDSGPEVLPPGDAAEEKLPDLLPLVEPERGTYTSSVQVVLTSPVEGGEIRYTLDGSDPVLGRCIRRPSWWRTPRSSG